MSGIERSGDRSELGAMNIGLYLLSFGTISAGILDLVWGGFDPGHQPVHAFGSHLSGQPVFAYIAGIWLIAGGAALIWRRTIRAGIWATAAFYLIFGLFQIPLFYTMTLRFGFHVTVILGVLAAVFLQFIMVAGCFVYYASVAQPTAQLRERSQLIARWTIGLTGVLVGVGHFANTKGLVHMIPKWMPMSPSVWIEISGLGFLFAGAAILIRILNVLAARLLTLMLITFEVALVPLISGFPHVHQAWGATAYNLTVAGVVWIYAVSITLPRIRQGPAAEMPVSQGCIISSS